MINKTNTTHTAARRRPASPRAFQVLAASLALVSGTVMVCAQDTPNADRFYNQTPRLPSFQVDWTAVPNFVTQWQPVQSPSTCFAEGTTLTPEMMRQWRAMCGIPENTFDSRYYFMSTRWYSNTVSYSFVPDGTNLSDGYTSTLFSMMDSKFGGDRSLWTGYIQSCFNAIQQVCGARFVQSADDGAHWPYSGGYPGVRGDIRISAGPIDGHYNVLAYAYGPGGGDMKLDIADNWERFADSYRYFRNVFTHELCHAMGLDHSCPGTHTKLMEPILSTNFDILQHDDILGLQAIYGDAQEPNNSLFMATVFTQSQPNTSVVFHTYGQAPNSATASVTPGDQDWIKSSVQASMPVTFTATPVGTSYDTSTQNTDGSCNSGHIVNSLIQTGLRVEIRNAIGSVLATSQGAPGQSVTVSAQVPQGDYYSVVSPVWTSFAMPQMYTLTRTVGAPQAPSNNRWFEGILLGQYPYGMTINGTTFGATTDSSGMIEPGGAIGTQDVYYNFSPWDGPGRFRVTVTGGNHVVSVHRLGNSAPSPSNQWYPINSNGGANGVVDVNVTDFGPCVVRVAVAPGGTAGPHTVSVRYIDGPANDSCLTPVDITSGVYNGTTIYARPEPSPYPASCTTDTFTQPWGAWYRYTATTEGTLSLSVCNANNTIMGVYQGCPDAGGTLVACNDNAPSCGNGGSALNVPVVAGQQYLIRVSHAQNLSGPFQLNVGFTRYGETCDTAIPVIAGATPYSNVGFSTDDTSCNGGANRWYLYTATGYSNVSVNTCDGTNYDSTLAAWTGCPSSGGALIACNDDSCGLQSAITFQSYPGQQFLLSVGGYAGSTGSGTLRINETPIPGEICSTPIVVTTGSYPYSTLGHYTNGPAEPNCNFCCGDPQVHGDLWYLYVATGTGTLTASTCGADYDSKMVAYTSCPSVDGQAIACADDECGVQARMSLPVTQGQSYLLRVGGYGGWTGTGTFTLSFAPACAADFNGDTIVDFNDYLDFVDALSTQLPVADFNHDSIIDFNDYLDFVDAFSVGC